VDNLCTERDLRILKGVQRKALIPVVGAYRTTSRDASDDTMDHFLIDCQKFEPQRVILRVYVGADSWRWLDVAPLLMRNPEAFSLFGEFCRESF